jgi:hypothetical protein
MAVLVAKTRIQIAKDGERDPKRLVIRFYRGNASSSSAKRIGKIETKSRLIR